MSWIASESFSMAYEVSWDKVTHWKSSESHRTRSALVSPVHSAVGWDQAIGSMASAWTWWRFRAKNLGPSLTYAPTADLSDTVSWMTQISYSTVWNLLFNSDSFSDCMFHFLKCHFFSFSNLFLLSFVLIFLMESISFFIPLLNISTIVFSFRLLYISNSCACWFSSTVYHFLICFVMFVVSSSLVGIILSLIILCGLVCESDTPEYYWSLWYLVP